MLIGDSKHNTREQQIKNWSSCVLHVFKNQQKNAYTNITIVLASTLLDSAKIILKPEILSTKKKCLYQISVYFRKYF